MKKINKISNFWGATVCAIAKNTEMLYNDSMKSKKTYIYEKEYK